MDTYNIYTPFLALSQLAVEAKQKFSKGRRNSIILRLLVVVYHKMKIVTRKLKHTPPHRLKECLLKYRVLKK